MGRRKKDAPTKEKTSAPMQQVSSTVAEHTTEENDRERRAVADIAAQAAEEQEKDQEKVRRNYKKEAQELREQLAGQDTQALEQGFKVIAGALLDVICIRLPNPVPATEQEKAIFGDAAGALAAKYANLLGPYREETTFLLATVLIVAPRFKRSGKKPATEKGTSDNATSRGVDTGENGIGQVNAGPVNA